MEIQIEKNLLSLVIDYEVTYIKIMPKISGKQRIFYRYLDEDDIECEESFCVEMLGRLCKEWCLKQGYELSSRLDLITKATSILWLGFVECLTSNGDTELEVIIKATHWVAKEKGLLK